MKLSTRGLKPDEGNIRYIESIFKEKNISESKLVAAYGGTISRCRTANLTKKMIFDLYRNYCPNNKVYPITTEYFDAENSNGVHVLYLGIRHSNETWRKEEYEIPDFDKILSENKETGSKKSKADKSVNDNKENISMEQGKDKVEKKDNDHEVKSDGRGKVISVKECISADFSVLLDGNFKEKNCHNISIVRI